MNNIEYKFTREGGTTTNWQGGYELILDGYNTAKFFDNQTIPLLNVREDGIYPLLVGVCGEFGCCGLLVKVVNNKDNVIWEKFYLSDGGFKAKSQNERIEYEFHHRFKVKLPLVFDRKKYEILALMLEKATYRLTA